MQSKFHTVFDIAIIGAGTAGLSFAAGLKDSDLKIAILEKQSRGMIVAPAYDGREIAITHHSRAVMERLGLWDKLPPDRISLIEDAKVLNGTSPDALHFSHTESGKENLGFMVSNHLIRQAAYDTVKDEKNIQWHMGAEVMDVKVQEHETVLSLSNGKTLRARLVVAADSRFSKTRDTLGIPTERLNFERTCIVCKMGHEKPHDKTAYECFFESHTLAVLPLNGQQVSIVMTLDSDEAGGILAMKPPEFARMIEEKIGKRLGTMKLVTELFPYPLVSTYAEKFYGPRYALLGDAAVGMHPVTAHGFNFGLRGADSLAHEILSAQKIGMDIGSEQVLRRYHHAHRAATRVMYWGTNALVKLYTNRTRPAAFLRGALLKLGNLPIAKRMIMNQLTESHAKKLRA